MPWDISKNRYSVYNRENYTPYYYAYIYPNDIEEDVVDSGYVENPDPKEDPEDEPEGPNEILQPGPEELPRKVEPEDPEIKFEKGEPEVHEKPEIEIPKEENKVQEKEEKKIREIHEKPELTISKRKLPYAGMQDDSMLKVALVLVGMYTIASFNLYKKGLEKKKNK